MSDTCYIENGPLGELPRSKKICLGSYIVQQSDMDVGEILRNYPDPSEDISFNIKKSEVLDSGFDSAPANLMGSIKTGLFAPDSTPDK